VIFQFCNGVRRQYATAGKVGVDNSLGLVDRPCQRLGDLWRGRAGLG